MALPTPVISYCHSKIELRLIKKVQPPLALPLWKIGRARDGGYASSAFPSLLPPFSTLRRIRERVNPLNRHAALPPSPISVSRKLVALASALTSPTDTDIVFATAQASSRLSKSTKDTACLSG